MNEQKEQEQGSNTVPPAPVQIDSSNVELDFNRQYPTVYANYALVNNGPNEISLNFSLIGFPYNTTTKEGILSIKAPVVAQVLLPLDVAEGLAKAIASQLELRRIADSMVKEAK